MNMCNFLGISQNYGICDAFLRFNAGNKRRRRLVPVGTTEVHVRRSFQWNTQRLTGSRMTNDESGVTKEFQITNVEWAWPGGGCATEFFKKTIVACPGRRSDSGSSFCVAFC